MKNIILAILIVIILVIIVYFIGDTISSNEYNNGICTRCGGSYAYQQAIGHQFTTSYMYQCNKCGNVIEIGTYY